MIYGARMVPYLLPAGWVAEVPLAEDDPVERSRELQVHRHPALLAGDVQTSDLEFCLLFRNIVKRLCSLRNDILL